MLKYIGFGYGLLVLANMFINGLACLYGEPFSLLFCLDVLHLFF